MNDQEINDLLNRYREGICTAAEKKAVEAWYNALDYKHTLTVEEFESAKERSWKQLNPIKKKKTTYLRYAAILIGLLSFSTMIYLISQNQRKQLIVETSMIKPGGNRATLVLGQKDSLDLTQLIIGETIESNGILIKKLADGTISYAIDPTSKATPLTNKLIVPRGGQYRIVLADSSIVLVNSESELEFPSQFNGHERRIKMIGEGYFEIAKNSSKPFIVQSKEQEVKVLGTKFNIEAYRNDKNIRTTLLEGKVQVTSGQQHIILKPGEQSLFDGEKIHISSASVASNTAWKDNLFIFQSQPLGSIMQKIARWYQAEVVFENRELAQIRFTGSISKNQEIDQVLNLLEMTDKIKFVIEQQTIYVKAK